MFNNSAAIWYHSRGKNEINLNDEREGKRRNFHHRISVFFFYMITKLLMDEKVEQRRKKKRFTIQKTEFKIFQVWDWTSQHGCFLTSSGSCWGLHSFLGRLNPIILKMHCCIIWILDMLSDVVSIDIIYIYFYMPYLIAYFDVTELWQRKSERAIDC